MLEKQVWEFIKKATSKSPNERWMRCENITANGVPDINCCINGREFWIEVKCPKAHKKSNTPVFGSSHKISPTQFAWFRRQRAAGGNALLLISNENLTLLLDATKIKPALLSSSLDEIKAMEGLIIYHSGPIDDAWPQIIAYLRGIK